MKQNSMQGAEYVQISDIIPVPLWETLPNLGQNSEFPINLHIERVGTISTLTKYCVAILSYNINVSTES